jgi:hypothetical protein
LTDDGTKIDESDEHFRNAELPIDSNLEFDSNVTVERDWHAPKHVSQSCSTDDGTKMEESDEHFQNAEFPIDSNLEFGSNVTVERD